jgi:dipeptidyl-peptidase 4
MKKRILYFIIIIWSFSCLIAFGQETIKLNLDNMNDPELFQAFSIPRFWWLEDNSALIFDVRKPAAERTLEKMDPKTGKRTVFLDQKIVKDNFSKLFTDGKIPQIGPIPAGFSKNGKYGYYLIEGDIFILNTATSSFTRVTNTPEIEKCLDFSPDGLKISFVRETDLYMFDILNNKEVRLTKDGTKTLLNGTLSWVYWEEIFGRRDIGYWWSPDSKSIAYLQSDESEVSIQSYVNFEPWTPTVKTQRYPKVGEKNPAVRLGVVEIDKTVTSWVDIDKNNYEYIVRVNWLPDSKSICVRTMNRLQTEMDFYIVDCLNGKSRFILKDKNEGWVNVSDDLYFLKDGKHFITSNESDGFEHLYKYTLDGKLVNQITKGEWAIRASNSVFWLRQAVAGIDEKDEWIYFTSNEKSAVEKHLYRIKFDGKKMERLTKVDGTHIISMSPDAKYYFDQVSDIKTPSSLTLFDSKGKEKASLATPNYAGFKKYDVQYAEIFTIPAKDGFRLPASITKPKDFDPAKKYPVIIYVYGGPSAPQVANSFQSGAIWENVLINNGYLCMKIDNRAATAISKKLENLILYKTPGEVELNDLVDAVKWMKTKPYVDPDRFGVWGWSGGGTNTILAMTRSKEFKAGIAGAGVTDFRFYDTKWGEAAMKTEKENLKGFEENSLLRYAKDLSGKLMIVHGTHDDNVHIQNTWRFVDELIKANKIFELMIYPYRAHGVGDPVGRKHLNNVSLDFWKRNL